MSKKRWVEYPQIASSEITPESAWLNRRNLMKAAAAGAGLAAAGETVAESKPTLELDTLWHRTARHLKPLRC